MENIIDRVRKLFALAADKSATESEAATALEMATALMAKYNIEHVTEKTNVKRDRRDTGKLPNWQLWIRSACANLNGCHSTSGRLTASFVGREEDIKAAWEMFYFINSQIERLYKRDLPHGLTQSRRANYRRTYKQACSIRIYQRAEQILNNLRTKDNQISGCTALVVAQSFDQRKHEADEFLKREGIVVGKRRTVHVKSGYGTFEGFKAGDEVKINERITNG